MTRRELIEYVQRQLDEGEGVGVPAAREVGRILDAAFAGIVEGLRREGRYSHPGFGTFTIKAQPTTVRFKPAREVKASLES